LHTGLPSSKLPYRIRGSEPDDVVSVLDRLKGKLVVSCQPVVGGPMDRTDIVVAFALAAEAGGAAGLRIEGVERVRAVRAATRLPVIGLVKRIDPSTPIIITPTRADVAALAEAGADIIAFDATDRSRPEPVAALAGAVHRAGRIAMADIATQLEAQNAREAGCDIIGTTLSGYLDGPVPEGPDIALVGVCAGLGVPVFAEGRYRTVDEVEAAHCVGAWSVVVGSAVTRPEHITAWLARGLERGGRNLRSGRG
jgi:putative N-acetylmannosamine-6-phosphate epimerase